MLVKPAIPNLSVPMAVWGGRPRKMRTGIVIKLVPPTRVPKELPMIPATKTINRDTRSITVRKMENDEGLELILM
jgi:hypothetical protein